MGRKTIIDTDPVRWSIETGTRIRHTSLSPKDRFLTHILPKGFMRIRHYGFLANRYRKQKLEQCRRLLDVRIVDVDVDSTDDGTSDREPPDNPQERQERTTRCPACKHGQMIQIFTLKPGQALPAEFVVQFHDTS